MMIGTYKQVICHQVDLDVNGKQYRHGSYTHTGFVQLDTWTAGSVVAKQSAIFVR